MPKQPKIAVIGSGIAGLMAALRLGKAGCAVTLFEAEPVLGGKMATEKFDVNGTQVAVDCGPTVFSMKPLFEDMFTQMGLCFPSSVKTTPHELLARHYWADDKDGTVQLDLFADLERSKDAIGAFSGARDAEAFSQVIAQAQSLFQSLDHTFMRKPSPNMVRLITSLPFLGLPLLLKARPWQSLWSMLTKDFRDPRLVQLFARYSTYCGGNPMKTSALFLLVLQAEFAGLWSITGGMAALAKAMEKQLKNCGVTIVTNTRINKILIDSNKITGVTLPEDQQQSFDSVVMAGDVSALRSMVPATAAGRAPPPVRPKDRSLSATTMTGVAKFNGLDPAAHTVFFSSDYKSEFDSIAAGNMPADPTLYLNTSSIANKDADDQMNRLFIIANAKALRNDTDGATAPSQKERQLWQNRMEQKLESMGLHLSHHTSPVMTLPEDFATRFPGSGGALYGRAPHGFLASFKRPGQRTKVSGLYLASGSAHPSAGVPMSALSGFTAAGAVIEDLVSMNHLLQVDTSGGTSTSSAIAATGG